MNKNTIHRKDTIERQHFVPTRAHNLHLKPELLYAGRLVKRPDWSDESHCHNFCEIMYINSGKGTIVAGGVSYYVNAGDIVIYNKNTVHSEKSDPKDPLEMYFAGVTNLSVAGLDTDCIIKQSERCIINTGYYSKTIGRYFKDIVTETENAQMYHPEIARLLLETIIFQIFRFLDYNHEDYVIVNENYLRAKRYIDKNYTQSKGLDEICKVLYMSKSYLSHLFKKHTGVPVLRYIIIKRMDMAKTLLSGSALAVNEVGEAVGYEDPAYFCRLFKNVLGMTPSEYRKSACKALAQPIIP